MHISCTSKPIRFIDHIEKLAKKFTGHPKYLEKKAREDLLKYEQKRFYETGYLDFYTDIDYIWLCIDFFTDFTWDATLDTIDILNYLNYIPNRIMDVGAGIGLSCLLFAKAFPDTEIIYQNLDSHQYEFAKKLFYEDCAGLGKITMVKNASEVKADVVTMYELLEHIKSPVDFIKDITHRTRPNFIFERSSFDYLNPGHYLEFTVDGKQIKHKDMHPRIDTEFNKLGYFKYDRVMKPIKRKVLNRLYTYLFSPSLIGDKHD